MNSIDIPQLKRLNALRTPGVWEQDIDRVIVLIESDGEIEGVYDGVCGTIVKNFHSERFPLSQDRANIPYIVAAANMAPLLADRVLALEAELKKHGLECK